MRFHPQVPEKRHLPDFDVHIKPGSSVIVWRHAEKEIGVNFVYHHEYRIPSTGELSRVEHPNAFIAYLSIEEAIRLKLELDRALMQEWAGVRFEVSPNIGGDVAGGNNEDS
jgi:hypothetical protein